MKPYCVTNDRTKRVAEKMTQLESVQLTFCCSCICCKETKYEKIRCIVERLPNIKSLALLDCVINDEDIQHLAVNLTTNLQSINISKCNNVTDVGIKYLSDKLPDLHALEISYCGMTDVGIKYLADKMINLHSLKLHCWNAALTSEGLCFMIEKLTKLQSIKFPSVIISDAILKSLSMYTKKLCVLDSMMAQTITDNGIKFIAESLINLESLDLSNCRNMTDLGIKHIAIFLINLRDLNLHYCDKLTDKGVTHLSNLNILRSLDLSYCSNITNKGLKYFFKLINLQSLDLSHCHKITIRGIKIIVELPELHSLRISLSQMISIENPKNITIDYYN